MVNAKHDITSYENCDYKHEIFNIENLYEAYFLAKKNSDWKESVQRFEMNLITELTLLEKELNDGTFKYSETNDFILNERGKTRLISGDIIRDRIVKRVLCDKVLIPAIERKLIYDNGASLRGKGISFSRDRLKVHLRKYYKRHGNDGYILLQDYSKFFDNIQHEKLLNLFGEVVDDKLSLRLLRDCVFEHRLDVSHMSDEEYSNSMNEVFDSLEHYKIDKSLLVGEKYLEKRLNIGDQVSQVAALYYPTALDSYIKIVRGQKYYGRYMDDSYVISKDRDFLKSLAHDIEVEAKKLGIFINKKKTQIVKLPSYWRFLQIQYSLTSTGRIIQKIHPQRLVKMRQKLKSLAGELSKKDFENLYNSWFKNHYKIMSKKQMENINKVYSDLLKNHYKKEG